MTTTVKGPRVDTAGAPVVDAAGIPIYDTIPSIVDAGGVSRLAVDVRSDIEIGAVEIKDATADTRVNVITQDAAFGTATNGLAVFGKYQAAPTTYTDGDAAPVLLDANGRIVLSSDIEIGAVELKDGTSDARAVISGTDGVLVNLGTNNDVTVTGTVTATVVGASTPADDFANPTTAVVSQCFNQMYDGSAWDMVRGTSADGLLVNLGTNNDISGTVAVTTVKPDGTNTMPSLDDKARAGYVQITDGTTIAKVMSGTQAGIYVGITDGASTVIPVIQNSAFGTANVGFSVYGKYMATPTIYDDLDAAPILLDANGRVNTTSAVASSNTAVFSNTVKDGSGTDYQLLCDSDGNLQTDIISMPAITGTVTANISGSISNTAFTATPVANSATILMGKTTVTTATTRVVLGSGAIANGRTVAIKALSTNTGLIYVGDVTVAAANGYQLSKGDVVSLAVNNLSVVYIDSSVNLEGVTFIVENA
jgi:hypothetical protein